MRHGKPGLGGGGAEQRDWGVLSICIEGRFRGQRHGNSTENVQVCGV